MLDGLDDGKADLEGGPSTPPLLLWVVECMDSTNLLMLFVSIPKSLLLLAPFCNELNLGGGDIDCDNSFGLLLAIGTMAAGLALGFMLEDFVEFAGAGGGEK